MTVTPSTPLHAPPPPARQPDRDDKSQLTTHDVEQSAASADRGRDGDEDGDSDSFVQGYSYSAGGSLAPLAEYDSSSADGRTAANDDRLKVHAPPSLAGLSDGEVAQLDKAATRKVDILLMPTLICLYILNFLDRNNVAIAKIGGMTDDLGMTAQQFSTVVAILFVGYISMQIPSNMIASRVARPSVYICLMCMLWGCVSACTGATRSFAGLLVCRLILGFTEAAFFPGAMWVLSTFYTSRQIALRTGVLYCGSQLGNAFGGLFALAILELDGKHGLEGWRWLFIVEGVMTVGLAAIFALYIPNKPATMRWLTPLERDRLLYRLEADRATKDYSDEMSTSQAFRLAITDVKVWLVAIALTVNFIPAGVTSFFPIVVADLGFNRAISLALTAPPYILCVFVITWMGWHSDKTQERTIHICCAFTVTIVANIIALSTTKIAPRYVAMMLMPASFYSSSITILSWMSSTIVGPHVKRAIAIAIINAVSNSPNIWTAYLYYQPPRYPVAFAVNLAASVMLIVVVLGKRTYLANLNRRLDKGEDLGPNGPTRNQVEAGFRFQL